MTALTLVFYQIAGYFITLMGQVEAHVHPVPSTLTTPNW